MSVLLAISRDDHAELLTAWALHLTAAEDGELVILVCREARGVGEPEEVEPNADSVPAGLWAAVEAFRAAPDDVLRRPPEAGPGKADDDSAAGGEGEGTPAVAAAWPLVTVLVVETANPFRSVMTFIGETRPAVLVTGQERSTRSSEATAATHLARRLFEEAPCDTLLLRLTDRTDARCRRILVPAGGGANSRRALRLGDRLARCTHGTLVPFHVLADVDEVSRAVGERILERALDRAGVDGRAELDGRERVEPRVVLGDDVDAAIRAEAEAGKYDLVLVGATHFGTVRRRLFGTIPDRLLRGEGALTVAVIRAARPLGERLRRQVGRFLQVTVPQLHRSDRIRLHDDLYERSKWSFDFMALIGLSTAIASLGLVQDSVAVVIGAMLVAPLMTPLLGAGLAIVQGNGPLLRDSGKAIVFGFLMAVLIGIAVGLVVHPWSGMTRELLARGGPSLLDMGVAFFSGVAASYCIARPKLSSALAGVAIAAALVPPIATVGISLAFRETHNARGAALLFGTNVVAIVIGAALSFYAAGIRGLRNQNRALWVRRVAFALVVALIVLAVPLASVIVSQALEQRTAQRGRSLSQSLTRKVESVLEDSGAPVVLDHVVVRRRQGVRTVEIDVEAPAIPPQELVDQLRNLVRDALGDDEVAVRVKTAIVISDPPPS